MGGFGTAAELVTVRWEDESSDQGFWEKGCMGDLLEAGCECECVRVSECVRMCKCVCENVYMKVRACVRVCACV